MPRFRDFAIAGASEVFIEHEGIGFFGLERLDGRLDLALLIRL